MYGLPATLEAILEAFDDGDDDVDAVEEEWMRARRVVGGNRTKGRYVKWNSYP